MIFTLVLSVYQLIFASPRKQKVRFQKDRFRREIIENVFANCFGKQACHRFPVTLSVRRMKESVAASSETRRGEAGEKEQEIEDMGP